MHTPPLHFRRTDADRVSSPGVKKTWDGILVLLLLSSVTLVRSLDSYHISNQSKSAYAIYFIPHTVLGASYTVLLILLVFLEDKYYYYFTHRR